MLILSEFLDILLVFVAFLPTNVLSILQSEGAYRYLSAAKQLHQRQIKIGSHDNQSLEYLDAVGYFVPKWEMALSNLKVFQEKTAKFLKNW